VDLLLPTDHTCCTHMLHPADNPACEGPKTVGDALLRLDYGSPLTLEINPGIPWGWISVDALACRLYHWGSHRSKCMVLFQKGVGTHPLLRNFFVVRKKRVLQNGGREKRQLCMERSKSQNSSSHLCDSSKVGLCVG
jgi:hypothetical protein